MEGFAPGTWVLKAHSKADAAPMEREKEVLQKLAGVSKPNSVRALAVHGQRFDLIEKCQAELFDLVFRTAGGFSEAACRVVLRHTLDSLATLHALGFAHNDIKPENVVLGLDMQCKLIDFGCCAPLSVR